MALTNLIPVNGAVTYTGLIWDFNSFRISGQQAVEVVTPYGAAIFASRNAGSQTPDFTFNITAFAAAHAASSAPNFAGATSVFSAQGAALLLTLDTGCSEACNAIMEQFEISHARMRAAVPATMRLKNSAELTELWATT